MSIIGDRIKARRQQLNLSQEELAQKIGYKSRSTINKIELGINDITQSKVIAFAKALDTTPAYLMGWTEVIEREKPAIENNDELSAQLKEFDKIFMSLSPEAQDKLIELGRLYQLSEQGPSDK